MSQIIISRCAVLGLSALVAACGQIPDAGADPQSPPTPSPPAQSADAAIPDAAATAAEIPDTEIFLASLAFVDGSPVLGAPTNITNHPGYDNQPSFTPDRSGVLFTSEGESGRTDIWRYDIAAGVAAPLWLTPTVSEYSPRIAPKGASVLNVPAGALGTNAPSGAISYIQENEEGDVTRVHARAMNADAPGAAVIDFAPLGYYAWLAGGAKLAVFYRSEPPQLYLVDVASGEKKLIADNIDRALYAAPGGQGVYFTTPRSDGGFTVSRYDLAAGAATAMFDLPGESADYAVFAGADGDAFFSADGAMLSYRAARQEDGAADWSPVADLSSAGLASITRLAVSDDGRWIAIVAEK